MNTTLVILGASALAREFISYGLPYDNFILVDDTLEKEGTLLVDSQSYRIQNDWTFEESYPFIVSIGNPVVKKRMVDKALKAGLYPAPTIIHPDAKVYGKCDIGKGGMVCPGTKITIDVIIKDYVILNLNCTIGHDTVIEDYVTLNPGVNVSGCCVISEQTVIGTNASIKDHCFVGARNRIGCQATVVKDIKEEDKTYTGVPAKILK
jgi:sugar O-acyltransferase (sialic acid O-acetyltransferase NeuD family)